VRIQNGQLLVDGYMSDESKIVENIINKEQQKTTNRSQAARTRVQPEARTFEQELINAGGIRPDGPLSGEIKRAGMHSTHGGRPGLINKNGITHEQALKLAIRKGYVPEKINPDGSVGNDVNDLEDLFTSRKFLHPELTPPEKSGSPPEDYYPDIGEIPFKKGGIVKNVMKLRAEKHKKSRLAAK
jgi:DNA-binding protein H-NS